MIGKFIMKVCAVFVALFAAICVVSAVPSEAMWKDFVFHQGKFLNGTEKLGLYSFSFNDCGGSAAQVRGNVSLAPVDPITLPGSLTASFNATFGVTLQAPLTATLTIQKKEFVWIKIPCVDNIGSCTYHDVCSMIPPTPSGCPPILKDANLPCQCPFKAGKYSLPPSKIDIQSIPSGIPAFLADGDFKVKVELYDGTTLLACADLAFTLKINN